MLVSGDFPSCFCPRQFSTNPHGEEFHFALVIIGSDRGHFSYASTATATNLSSYSTVVSGRTPRAQCTDVEIAIHLLPVGHQ
jgi:hypothetical protein